MECVALQLYVVPTLRFTDGESWTSLLTIQLSQCRNSNKGSVTRNFLRLARSLAHVLAASRSKLPVAVERSVPRGVCGGSIGDILAEERLRRKYFKNIIYEGGQVKS